MADAKSEQRNVVCIPAVGGEFQPCDGALDKFRTTLLVEAKWRHRDAGFTVDATPDYMKSLAAKHEKYKGRVESFVPLGHTTKADQNTGAIELLEVVKGQDGKHRLDAILDIRDPAIAQKIRNKTITGKSIGIHKDFWISNPDGTIDDVGDYVEHAALTTVPVIGQGHLGGFEPFVELAKDGAEVRYWPLAAMDDDAFMDPPDDVVNGERLATHEECDYRAGTAKASCSSCLAYCYCPNHCDFVEGPIKQAGLCNFFRAKYGCMDREVLLGRGIAMLEEDIETVVTALDATMPYGNVTYADPGYQKDKVKRYPIDVAARVRAAWNYINKEKNAAKYSSGQLKQIRARIIAAWKAKIDKEGPPSAKEMEREPNMSLDIAALSKELGLELKDDMDPKAIAEAIKAKLAPAEGSLAADPKQTEQLAALAKESGEIKAELERQKNENTRLSGQVHLMNLERRLVEFSARIDRCELTGRMTPAERQRLLLVGNDDKGQPRTLSLHFDRAAPQAYGKDWEDALTRREIKLEAYEERDQYSAVPQEIIPRQHSGNLLDRWTDPLTPNGDKNKKTKEDLAREKEEKLQALADRCNGKKSRATAA